MNTAQPASRTRMLFSILAMAVMAGAARAQKADTLLPAPLPETFTLSYTVVSKDVRTDAMRESERLSDRAYWLRQASSGRISQGEADKVIAGTAEEYKHPTPTKEYLLTLSFDGSRMLCVTKSKDGTEFTVGIYSADENKTYFVFPQRYSALPQAYKGFNYSALRMIPLLPYRNPKLGLYFLKDGLLATPSDLAPLSVPATVSQTNSSRNTTSGRSENTAIVAGSKWVMKGSNPVTRDFLVHVESEIPYGPALVTLARIHNKVEVQKCVGYHSNQVIATDWTYSHYATKLGVRLPGNIVYRQYNTFVLDGVTRELPKTEFDYTLASAHFEPLASERFDMHVWGKEIWEAKQEAEEGKQAAEAKRAAKTQPVAPSGTEAAARTPQQERTAPSPSNSKPEVHDARAEVLWREVVAATRAARTLSAALMVSDRTEDGNTASQTGKVLLQKPNLARIALPTVWGDSMTVASDGKRSWRMMSDPEPIPTAGESPYVYREVPADPQGRNIQANYTFAIPFFFNPEQSLASLVGSVFAIDKVGEPHYAGKATINGQECDVLEQTVTQPITFTTQVFIGSDKLLRRLIVEFPKIGNPRHGYYFVADLNDVVVNKPIPPATFAYTLPKNARPYVAQPQSASTLVVGQPAPDFTINLLNGGTQTLTEALKGKKAMYLDFWFVDCLTCRHEFPHLQKLYAALKTQGLEIIALDCGDETDRVREAMQTLDYLKPATFSIALTGTGKPKRELLKKYDVDGYPTGILISPEGKIVLISYGFSEAKGLDALQATLKKMGFML